MVDYHVLPHQGIGPVSLRMTQDDVRRVIGVPSISLPFRGRLAPADSYHSSGLKIEYDFDSRVQFIEASASRGVRYLYGDRSVFDTRAEDLIRLVEANAPTDTSHHEFPATVV